MKPTEILTEEHKIIKIVLEIMNNISNSLKINGKFEIEHIEKIIDFIINFADKYHHAKEETALFPELINSGMSKDNGPVHVMLYEHEIGRSLIKEILSTIEAFKNGNEQAKYLIADNMDKYTQLLYAHIHKEDNILFPMANNLISDKIQNDIYIEFKRIEQEFVVNGVLEQYQELLKNLKNNYFV